MTATEFNAMYGVGDALLVDGQPDTLKQAAIAIGPASNRIYICWTHGQPSMVNLNRITPAPQAGPTMHTVVYELGMARDNLLAAQRQLVAALDKINQFLPAGK